MNDLVLRRRFLQSAAVASIASVSNGCEEASSLCLRVMAASSLRGVALSLEREWSSRCDIEWNFGSSGILAAQICSGLPADIFLAANKAFADRVLRCMSASSALPASSTTCYVRGRLAWWPSKPMQAPESLVIPDPAVAPYGAAALQVVAEQFAQSPRIILAPSAAAVVQMIDSGAAGFGLTSASVVLMRQSSAKWASAEPHDPIDQYSLRLTDPSSPLHSFALEFSDFLTSDRSRSIWHSAGFEPVSSGQRRV